MKTVENLRNIAIIAHVDHGKTTLVDALFQQGGMFREGQVVAERIMDSNDQERERGITILAKSTSVQFGEMRFQLVDTPGHADFGAEVERTLRMVDGVLLLVDAAEGPLPQTRFVLRKSFDLGLHISVAINKIDRSDARIAEVLDEVYDLFIDLGANEEQLDFPIVYTNAREGTATIDMDVPGTDLQPLVKILTDHVPAPADHSDEPFLMQVNSLSYDDYVGRLVIGRIRKGGLKVNDHVFTKGKSRDGKARIAGLFTFQGVERIPLKEGKCGDIVAIAGIEDIDIGDTLSAEEKFEELAPIAVDEPTVAMVFQVNDGPLSGKSGGKFLTSRHIKERLEKEAYSNVSIHILPGEEANQFRVLGRGELQLAVLIESMRREKFEFCVRNPEVVTRQGEAGQEEPTERLSLDVPIEHLGAVNELLGKRKAKLIDQRQEGSRVRLLFIIPTRGLLGLRGIMLTTTRGTAISNSVFEGWIPWTGPIPRRTSGAVIADRAGTATPYAIFHMQPRGSFFIPNGTTIYEGMIIGEHNRSTCLNVNATREKKQTNVRASGKDDAILLTPPRTMGLEQSLEWIRDDEMVEVTPEHIRIRKIILKAGLRPKRRDDE